MSIAGFPTSSDIYLEADGVRVAVVQSYTAKTTKSSTAVEAFGEAEPVEGGVIDPPRDDAWMIERSQEYGTVPVLTLTPFGEDGKFNNNLIHQVVTNEAAAERLLNSLAVLMQEKGYGGIDIDFEYILATDRDAFTAFVRRAAQIMHPLGFSVSVALAPKTSAEQKGLLYEGKDYAALGDAADEVLLMTYEWGYTYEPTSLW